LAPDAPSTTAAPVAASTAATVPPVALTGEFGPFDERLRSAFIGNGALAISVAVARDGDLVHAAAFGVANPATGEAVSPAHRFRVASNSKLLTATAVLELVEDGRLGLDEPVLGPLVTKLGVAPAEPGIAAITLRQLLSHTSGFPEYQRTFFGGAAANCVEAARRGLGGALLGPPGTVYRYSNMNYCLIGLLIETLTERPYETVVQEDVLEPLGISDMRMAGTYDVRPGDVAHPTTPGRTFMEALGGAGAWIGTASDLVAIVDGLDRSRPGWHPLSEFMVAQMLLPQAGIPYSAGQWYGLGLRVWADGTWGHTGTVENARSMVIRRPDGITWAVTISGNAPSNTDRIRTYVDEAFATIGIAAPPVTAALPPAPATSPTTAPTTAAPST
jgi:D-alanyl-D-alanine carboxypeptidase